MHQLGILEGELKVQFTVCIEPMIIPTLSRILFESHFLNVFDYSGVPGIEVITDLATRYRASAAPE